MVPCRVCKNTETTKFLSLGNTPLANSFLRPDQLDKPQACYPLDVVFCSQCGLVQLGHAVSPEVMFRDYIYVSSTSDTMTAHFSAYAEEIVAQFVSSPNDLVLEIGSNDGCLLRAFRKDQVRAVGIEPAANIAERANAAGIKTFNDFFCTRSAREIKEREGAAQIIIGNNVLAHIADLHDTVAGLQALLAKDGIAIFEVPYLIDLLQKDEFDTIYHEHVSYFAIRPLQRLFDLWGLQIFDVKRVPVHGGSVRVYVQRVGASRSVLPSVEILLSVEKTNRLGSLETYSAFAVRVEKMKQELTGLLRSLKTSGARIAGYGAPAKGNTLLNHFQIGSDLIEFIVDRSPYKHGMYTPGSHIPVTPVEMLLKEQPDYVLLLAWNFADEVIAQQREYLKRGGHFIVPIPQPKVIGEKSRAIEVVDVQP